MTSGCGDSRKSKIKRVHAQFHCQDSVTLALSPCREKGKYAGLRGFLSRHAGVAGGPVSAYPFHFPCRNPAAPVKATMSSLRLGGRTPGGLGRRDQGLAGRIETLPAESVRRLGAPSPNWSPARIGWLPRKSISTIFSLCTSRPLSSLSVPRSCATVFRSLRLSTDRRTGHRC